MAQLSGLRRALADHLYGTVLGALAGATTLTLLVTGVLLRPWESRGVVSGLDLVGLSLMLAFPVGLACFAAGILVFGWALRRVLERVNMDRLWAAAAVSAVVGGVAGTLVFNQWPDLTGWIACVAAASAVAGVTYRHAAKARQ